MDRKTVLCGIFAGAMLCIATAPALAEDVVIKVWSRADRSGPLRAGNIVTAGDTMNKMLAAAGSDKRREDNGQRIQVDPVQAVTYHISFGVLNAVGRYQPVTVGCSHPSQCQG